MLSLLAGGLEQGARAANESAMRNCKTALVVANEDRRHAIPRSEVLTRGAPRRKEISLRRRVGRADWIDEGGGRLRESVTVKRSPRDYDSSKRDFSKVPVWNRDFGATRSSGAPPTPSQLCRHSLLMDFAYS